MLNKAFSVCILMLSGAACAHEDSGVNCPYSGQVTPGLNLLVSGQVNSENSERDKGSGEYLAKVKQELRFDSGDSVCIEQKNCTMYNLAVVYRLTETSDSNFESGRPQ